MSDGNGGSFDFSCNVTHVGTIPTPGFVTDAQAAQLIASGEIRGLKKFTRNFFGSGKAIMPDGVEIEHWGFDDGNSDNRHIPSPQIRLMEGEVAQVKLTTGKKVHTIHHHGIEPDPMNDGVGHTSFETSGSYIYQWRPSEAGSYWYHCHVNTVLHVQMGMAGTLIVDPVVHPDYPVPAGARRSFVDGPLYDVATEAFLAPYALDPRWHTLSHAAGLSGEDVGLNRFDPKFFYVVGGALAGPSPRGDVIAPTQLQVNTSGHPTLLRMLNLNYFPSRAVFTDSSGNPVEMAELIAHDGRPFRDTSSPNPPSKPVRDTGHPLRTSAIAFGAAERYDALLHPPGPGLFMVTFQFIHWATGRVLATRSVPLNAS